MEVLDKKETKYEDIFYVTSEEDIINVDLVIVKIDVITEKLLEELDKIRLYVSINEDTPNQIEKMTHIWNHIRGEIDDIETKIIDKLITGYMKDVNEEIIERIEKGDE